MSGTIQASIVKDSASATNNLVLDTSGNVTVGNGLTVNGSFALASGSGTSGQVLTSAGAGVPSIWSTLTPGFGISISNVGGVITISSGGGGQSYITTNTTAVAGAIYYADTTSAAFTLTLPSSPTNGAVVSVFDTAGKWNINPLTISASQNINGVSGTLVCNVQGQYLSLQYVTASNNWRLQ